VLKNRAPLEIEQAIVAVAVKQPALRQVRVSEMPDTLVRVSHLATHIEGHLAELDINPLMVLPSSRGVKAVDALVVLRGTIKKLMLRLTTKALL
jgi:hypothetical protein